MKKISFVLFYLVLVCLWCVLFYQFMSTEKGPKIILLLAAGSVGYSVIWGLFISLFQRMLGWKGYGMLMLPLAIMFVFILGVPRSTFLFAGGLVLASELVTLAVIYAHNRKK